MSQEPGRPENRQSERIPLSSVSLPFLGIREVDHLTFQFFLQDVSKQGVQISIPEWVVAWNKLQIDDEISLFLPIRVQGQGLNRGSIVWLKRDENHREQHCGAHMEEYVRTEAFQLSLDPDGIILWQQKTAEETLRDYVADLLKDSSLLKKNILIYLAHLMPYFSRITKDRERYPEIRSMLFEDIRRQVEEHYLALKSLSEKVASAKDAASGLSELLDFEQLRQLMDSELDPSLFQMVFEKETILWYLDEIKQLEHRLFFNYNALIISHVLVLEKSTESRMT